MSSNHNHAGSTRARVLRPLADLGGRVTAPARRPLSGAIEAAAHAGLELERRALDRVLDSSELERIILTALASPRVQAAARRALASDGTRRLVDSFFDSGLFDHFIVRLGESDALWQLIDEIAQSPTVTMAISQQGLGFADQVSAEVRHRSRSADDWLGRTARRLAHRQPKSSSNELPPSDGLLAPSDGLASPSDGLASPPAGPDAGKLRDEERAAAARPE